MWDFLRLQLLWKCGPPGRVRRAGAAGARPGVVIDALQGRASRLGGLLRAQHAEVGLCLAAAAGLSPSRLCARHGEVRRQKARKMCVCGRVIEGQDHCSICVKCGRNPISGPTALPGAPCVPLLERFDSEAEAPLSSLIGSSRLVLLGLFGATRTAGHLRLAGSRLLALRLLSFVLLVLRTHSANTASCRAACSTSSWTISTGPG